jgi:hypothetical protein
MSKEWTINSFWIEEELKGFLSQKNPSTHLDQANKENAIPA